MGKQVATFDPPGIFRSTRPAQVTVEEMPECAEGTMNLAGPSEPVDLLGHSMGGLCALAFALGDPERVRRLVLVCSGSGGPIIRRAKGWPANHCLTDFDFRRLTYWGFRGVLVAGPARTAARSG